KLVDTPASGAGDRKVVEVRVFFWAPISSLRLDQFQRSHKNPRKRVFAFWTTGLLILKSGVYRLKRSPYSAPHQQRQR
ncbi:hypothetical protein WH284_06425, partial [Pseudomonas sp. MYb371]|uniref:hypothetical protein n=1 Tax=Pseudomonas sp. MYb371 TaxID=2745268 RepID=UPI003094AFC8